MLGTSTSPKTRYLTVLSPPPGPIMTIMMSYAGDRACGLGAGPCLLPWEARKALGATPRAQESPSQDDRWKLAPGLAENTSGNVSMRATGPQDSASPDSPR